MNSIEDSHGKDERLSHMLEFFSRLIGGKPELDKGKYVEVWKRQADGSWKVAIDTFNSDLPLPTPEKKK